MILFILSQQPEVSSFESDSFPSRGKTSRDICFSSSGKWLLMAHQDSNDIQVCSFDPQTGRPENKWAQPLKLGTPACLILLD